MPLSGMETFSVTTQFTVSNGKKSGLSRGIGHTHARATNGIVKCRILFSPFSGVRQSSWTVAWEHQWHRQVQDFVEKRAPYSSRNPMTLTLTQQNPW
jgi:hypothetical protein